MASYNHLNNWDEKAFSVVKLRRQCIPHPRPIAILDEILGLALATCSLILGLLLTVQSNGHRRNERVSGLAAHEGWRQSAWLSPGLPGRPRVRRQIGWLTHAGIQPGCHIKRPRVVRQGCGPRPAPDASGCRYAGVLDKHDDQLVPRRCAASCLNWLQRHTMTDVVRQTARSPRQRRGPGRSKDSPARRR